MISTVLASQKKVFQTIGNQNSQIGVPLTLSHLTREDEIAVLEIGMSERGQIEKLTNMIRPNVAVVTMIGVSHIAVSYLIRHFSMEWIKPVITEQRMCM